MSSIESKEKQIMVVPKGTLYKTIVYAIYFTTISKSNLHSFVFFVKNTQILFMYTKKSVQIFMFYKVYLLKHFEVGYPGK